MAMYGNGATIGMTVITIRARLRAIQQVYKRALPVSYEVAAGTTVLATVVQLVAAATGLTKITTS